MDYENKYKEALEAIKKLQEANPNDEGIQNWVNEIFPELKESEDEKIKRELCKAIWNYIPYEKAHEYIAYLKKQGKQEQLYIRFGEIPTDEKSKIYQGEIEIGIEEGISVYPAFEDKEGNIILGLNLPISKTSLHTQQHLLEYDNRPCYLLSGEYIGKGTDGEPLIKNARIIKEIKPYRMKQDKENNTYKINNTPNCGISVYNEELKEPDGERIRKEIIEYIKTGTYHKDWIAWLEKQESVEEIVERCKDSWYNEGKIAGMAEGLTDDEKYQQGWHDAVEKQVPVDKDKVVKGVRRGVATSLINYIDANSKGMCLSNMECEDIEDAIVNNKWYKVYGYMKKKLEKQGEKPQDKTEEKTDNANKVEQSSAWSEEDDYNVQCLAAKVTSDIQNGNVGRNQELIDWLKSIKGRVQPQNMWKPSEEQIKALEHFVRGIGESGYISPYDANIKLVHSLLNDLKKLK